VLVEGAQTLLVIVHCSVYATPTVPEKVDVGLDAVPKDPPLPLTILQLPEPTLGAFAARVTEVSPHVVTPVWLAPALAVVGSALTVMVTFDDEDVHGALLIVHVSTYVPAPPAGVKVAAGLVVLLNWLVDVLGPLATDQEPVPTLGLLAPKLVEPFTHIVLFDPAFDAVGF
jgi:hypothetical protein